MGKLLTKLGVDAEDAAVRDSEPPPTSQRRFLPERSQSSPDPPNESAAAPVFVIRDLATEIGVESPSAVRSALSMPDARSQDLIADATLSSEEASDMLKMSETLK